MNVFDILSLHHAGLTADEALSHYRKPYVRAVVSGGFSAGPGAMVLSRTESLTTSGICLDPVRCGFVVPVPPYIQPSGNLPGLFNIFALITLHAGIHRSFRAFLRDLGGPQEGVRDAAALVLGLEDVHALLEVNGDDLHAVTSRLFELTDHEDVADVRTMVVPAETAHGFGVPLEEKVAPKKAQAKRAAGARAGK